MLNGKFLEKNKCDVPNKRDGRKLWKIRKKIEGISDIMAFSGKQSSRNYRN